MSLTTQNLATILQALPREVWRTVAVNGSHGERNWIPVFEHGAAKKDVRCFGLLDDGTWCALSADGAHASASEDRVPFLPLLEASWTDVVPRLVIAIRALGLSPKLAWCFPFDEVLILALGSSEYWRTLAERWISAHYPLTDEIAALVPRHARSRARHLARMESIFGAENALLSPEFEAAHGSFLMKLRGELEWDKEAFNRLTAQMYDYIQGRDRHAPIPRWVAEGFWFLDSWVREWSSHESFPRPHGDAYYDAAYDRLHSLAFWLFTGSSAHEGRGAHDPL